MRRCNKHAKSRLGQIPWTLLICTSSPSLFQTVSINPGLYVSIDNFAKAKIKCNCPVNVEDGGADALALLLFTAPPTQNRAHGQKQQQLQKSSTFFLLTSTKTCCQICQTRRWTLVLSLLVTFSPQSGTCDRKRCLTKGNPAHIFIAAAEKNLLNIPQDGRRCRIDVSILEEIWSTAASG